jgi:hypothetical protein
VSPEYSVFCWSCLLYPNTETYSNVQCCGVLDIRRVSPAFSVTILDTNNFTSLRLYVACTSYFHLSYLHVSYLSSIVLKVLYLEDVGRASWIFARFQASITTQLTSALFWDIKQRRVVILYRRFGIIYRSHFQGSSTSLPLIMGPICCPETLLQNYHSTLPNISEDRRSEFKIPVLFYVTLTLLTGVNLKYKQF